MKNIALKLIEYGFSFAYENHNSNGEEIEVYQIYLNITNKEGWIILEFEGQTEKFEENEASFEIICKRVEEIIIEETSSF